MKIRQATLYRLEESSKPLITFYIAIGFTIALSWLITSLFTTENVTINGMEGSSFVFVFVMGLNSFKPQLKLFLQNGISRLTLFFSGILNLVALGLVCGLVDGLLSSLLNGQLEYSLISSELYEKRFLSNLVWSFCSYFLCGCFGFLLSVLYYRMNAIAKVAFSIAIPLLLFVGLPVYSVLYPDAGLLKALLDGCLTLLGRDSVTGVFNPYSSAGYLLLFSAALLCLTFPMVRRAGVKN